MFLDRIQNFLSNKKNLFLTVAVIIVLIFLLSQYKIANLGVVTDFSKKTMKQATELLGKIGIEQRIAIVLVVVVIFYFAWKTWKERRYVVTQSDTIEGVTNLNPNNYKLNWNHKDAASYLDVLINKFGNPSIVVASQGGHAIWEKEDLEGTCFSKLELRDESIYHCKPLPHQDFFYSYINYEVIPSYFKDVLSLSGSISYDALKKELRARCGSWEANVATLDLATKIGNGIVSLEHVQSNNLYETAIKATNNPESVGEMYKDLYYNISHQMGSPNPTGHFALAFSGGC